MKLDFAFFADSAVVTPNGVFSVLNGGIDWLQASAFPATLPNLVVLARVSFEADECGKTHNCVIHVTDPEGDSLEPDLSLSMNVPINQRYPENGNTFMCRFGYDRFPVTKPGFYRFSFTIDGRSMGEVAFEVIGSAQS